MIRPRRFRQTKAIRDLMQEHHLMLNDLVLPVFVHDQVESVSIDALEGHQRLDEISLLKYCEQALSKGISSIAIFPSIDEHKKTSDCLEALNEDNLMCHITRRVKKAFGDDLIVIGDIALDPYSSDGHDGLVKDGKILNDETVDMLAKMALVQAAAGVDILAPSDMMDGRVMAIRSALDIEGFHDKLIMSYTAKYASSFYGPFRSALNSAPKSGDKKTYQMNMANRTEAALELDLDVGEGADILMVKPAGLYLDIISDYRNSCGLPIAAYQVSGEYAMLKSAARDGVFNFDDALMESLLGIKRAGATIILTYGALEVANILNS
ncbi:porphobilinogen synthase [Candidatus Marinamargulisbacteria bacterium SCGC AG-343-K17]|nr:porphobilinogen synthase [Candidatus Marinamargulisbacteria bacterium SCGC AG-343-K17]